MTKTKNKTLSDAAIKSKQAAILDLIQWWGYCLELKTNEQIMFSVPFGKVIQESQLELLEQYGELVNHPIQGGILTIEVLLNA